MIVPRRPVGELTALGDVRLPVARHVRGERPVACHLDLELIVVDFVLAARESHPGPSEHHRPCHCHRHHTTSHATSSGGVRTAARNGEYTQKYTGRAWVSCNGLASPGEVPLAFHAGFPLPNAI